MPEHYVMDDAEVKALVKSRDEWRLGDEYRRCFDGPAHGKYLANRMELAYIAGFEAALAFKAKDSPDARP